VPMCVLAVQKRFWLETEGKVVTVNIQSVNDPDGRRVPNYVLLYEYRISGVQFFGTDRIPIDVPYHREDDFIKDLLARFTPGERIRVYYSKRNPASSSARRDVVGLQKALTMVGIGVIAVIVFVMYTQEVFRDWS